MEFKNISVKNFSIESTIAKDFFDRIIELIVSSLKNFQWNYMVESSIVKEFYNRIIC